MKKLLQLIVLLFAFSVRMSAEYVSPEMFGAKGDGINDDTHAFEQTINTGCDIRLKNKTYIITHLKLLKNQRLEAPQGARVYYKSLELTDGCVLKNVVFDGRWDTKGVTILGNNVLVVGCSFVNTKNSLSSYGGLTSAIWIGRYQDLAIKTVQYHDVRIEGCTFDGCSPYDLDFKQTGNKTVARCILSYGCNNLVISGCVFKNLKGYLDSDYIQLVSFEEKNNAFPFHDENAAWEGNSPPFKGYSYAYAGSIIKKCTFFQSDCKSSIKIMTGGVTVSKNKFIVNNASDKDIAYAVVRAHISSDVLIKNNMIDVVRGRLNSALSLLCCLNSSMSKNKLKVRESARIESFFQINYSKDCTVKNNVFEASCQKALINTEFNQSVSIINNRFCIRDKEIHMLELFVQQTNHYSYPSSTCEKNTLFENNLVETVNDDTQLMTANRYDYLIELSKKSMKFKRLRNR